VGGPADDEIPPLVTLFYLFRGVEPDRPHGRSVLALIVLRREIYAGAPNVILVLKDSMPNQIPMLLV
jgi:hypothetical protein